MATRNDDAMVLKDSLLIKASRILIALVVAMTAAATAGAQTTTATLTGSITDVSSAAIPQAQLL